ncbi:motile sperm domain-containing protein 1-like isoform X3 [Cottoperca gobio]|uniref:Motile sperm domain-containing protein 1-like isoform X3 n=1 Tax=Cottoperca gobio TaxID=56716 RepID=A0A6J2PF00_COTGO|nr:motile sperm domain-containing protein 1-like isoform X3 [Cottoperca gobio]
MRRKDSREGQGGAEQGGGREDRGQEVVRRAGGETGDVSPLPVFLFPSELLFYCEQRSSHRRVLTLYNPYSFSLCFKNMLLLILHLLPVRVVRHLDVAPRHRGRRDRFRLEVRGGGRAGGREIWAELRGGEEEGGREEEGGGGEERKRRGAEGQQRALSPLLVHTHLPTCTAVRSVSQWVVCAVLAVLCVAVLMLPLHTDSGSVVPRCLHVSTNQKLVCAYTLGLLTMVFLR